MLIFCCVAHLGSHVGSAATNILTGYKFRNRHICRSIYNVK